ncbi:hypothetical protein CFN16_11430, partial [Pseudomonas fluorescens]
MKAKRKKGWPWSTVIVANTHQKTKDTAHMDRRRQILQHQQQRFRRHASNCDAYAFFNLLTAPELLQRVESALPEHRERLYPPTETLSM